MVSESNRDAEKERLRILRKQAKELADRHKDQQLEEATQAIKTFRLKIDPRHFDTMKRISVTQNIPYFLATRELRRKIMHDEQDFTLPDCPASRMQIIINHAIEVSRSKSWEATFRTYLMDGNEQQLLSLMEELSWKAFEANKTLLSFLADLETLPDASRYEG